MSGPEWRDRAACDGLPDELFFPGEASTRTTQKAWEPGKAICRGCPVRAHCLGDELDFEFTLPGGSQLYGLYGGLTPTERLPLLKPAGTDRSKDCADCGQKFSRPSRSRRTRCPDCAITRRRDNARRHANDYYQRKKGQAA